MRKYLFLDIDGTVRETVPRPTAKNPADRRPPLIPDEVKLIEGIAEKLKHWQAKGWLIVGVSNQGCIEKGWVTADQVELVMAETLRQLGMEFPIYYAPHKRQGTVQELRLRKPNIGMAELAYSEYGKPDLEKSFVVGDYINDERFAKNLGLRYFDVREFLNGRAKSKAL